MPTSAALAASAHRRRSGAPDQSRFRERGRASREASFWNRLLANSPGLLGSCPCGVPHRPRGLRAGRALRKGLRVDALARGVPRGRQARSQAPGAPAGPIYTLSPTPAPGPPGSGSILCILSQGPPPTHQSPGLRTPRWSALHTKYGRPDRRPASRAICRFWKLGDGGSSHAWERQRDNGPGQPCGGRTGRGPWGRETQPGDTHCDDGHWWSGQVMTVMTDGYTSHM